MWFNKYIGVNQEDLNEENIAQPGERSSLSLIDSQPSIWNKYGKKKGEHYPVVSIEESSKERNKKLETILGIKIHTISKENQAENLAHSIHAVLTEIGYIHKMSRDFEYYGSFIVKRQPPPVFVYIGSLNDGTLFGIVMNENGEIQERYFNPSCSSIHVENLWERILTDYDFRGAILSVILFGDLYDIAVKNKCPVLGLGCNLSQLWDEEITQFLNSELEYESLGFTESVVSKHSGQRSSSPSFCVINQFNGNKYPSIFSNIPNKFVWNIAKDRLHLMSPCSGEKIVSHNIQDMSPINIAEIIINI